MDFSWLLNLLVGILKRLNPLHWLRWSALWGEFQKWYATFKKWRDWYRDHIQKQIDAFRKLQRQIYTTFFLPIIRVVDTIRRLSQIVGIFNQKLAAKLNSIFFRIEGKILAPFNALVQRMNIFGSIARAILTPLGYFDRATLLNSLWRDAKYLRVLVHNPIGQILPTPPPLAAPLIADRVQTVKDYLSGAPSDFGDKVDARVAYIRNFFANGLG